jgi:hypothetical protein
MEMRWRRYINLVALIGVLMHAGMIVRHHEVMLGAHLERQNLISALGASATAAGRRLRHQTPNCPGCRRRRTSKTINVRFAPDWPRQ